MGKNKAYDPKDNYPGDYVRVTTINADAGLEIHIVFLVGLRLLFEKEQSLPYRMKTEKDWSVTIPVSCSSRISG